MGVMMAKAEKHLIELLQKNMAVQTRLVQLLENAEERYRGFELKRKKNEEKSSKAFDRIVRLLSGRSEEDGLTPAEIAHRISFSQNKTRQLLSTLRLDGKIASAPNGRGFRYFDPFENPLD